MWCRNHGANVAAALLSHVLKALKQQGRLRLGGITIGLKYDWMYHAHLQGSLERQLFGVVRSPRHDPDLVGKLGGRSGNLDEWDKCFHSPFASDETKRFDGIGVVMARCRDLVKVVFDRDDCSAFFVYDV